MRRWRRMAAVLVVGAVAAAGTMTPAAARGGPRHGTPGPGTDASVPRVPQLTALPVTDESFPYLSAGHETFPTSKPLPRGYVEEEYLLSGDADLYGYDDELQPEVISEEPLPYTTRLLVRRPAKRSAFSGTVLVEALNPSIGADLQTKWSSSAELLGRSGHAYVGVTVANRGAAQPVDALAAFDPERYAALDYPDMGVTWDLLAQLGATLQSRKAPNPLARLGVQRVYLTGASQSGTIIRTFLEDGFHARAKSADGSPVYDAHLITISSGPFQAGYWSINSDTPMDAVPVDDPRRTISAHGVPVVELLSEGEAATHLTARRPDSSTKGDRYRLYEVAGARHTTVSLERVCGEPGETVANDLPMEQAVNATIANLDRWVRTGRPMPTAPRLELVEGPDPHLGLPLVRDDDGNAVGGLRLPMIRVPNATYTASGKTHFTEERLAELYPTKGHHLAAMARAVRDVRREGFLPRDDARAQLQRAAEVGPAC